MATVLVPWRGGDPYRETAWRWVYERWMSRTSVASALNLCPAPPGAWSKGAAIMPHVARSQEIVIVADADCWCDGIEAAVDAVEAGAPWAIPHGQVHRLDQEGTEAVLAGADWEGQPLTQPPYKGFEGGGIVVARREVLEQAPLDRRFVGWGQEDECHAMALRTLAGPPWRGQAPLIHLWHPPQARENRRRGSEESWALRKRYVAARKDPIAMAELLAEGSMTRVKELV